jgi:hypothetical protein
MTHLNSAEGKPSPSPQREPVVVGADYMKHFCNPAWRHSALGYLAPLCSPARPRATPATPCARRRPPEGR